ncbi:MauE/DoxX family redox-associated membrane protein [Flavobacterium sp. T12S277]|uniref:MauE/DoxX family redox-associated membrane protein n=1 Tax=Flavobacterium sp. T12S277 TaxID=3402752 RepID=UPI003AD8B809
MKTSISFKNTIVDIICLLYILLFVYAAVSKLLDFENFRVQLGQSPLLSAFAGYIAWMVPILELLIVVLIGLKRCIIMGLFGALCLMIIFTTYIFIILNYSPFVPCSCGGILEKMGWEEHFIFNFVFIMLAVAGILILRRGMPKTYFISKPASLASVFSITIFFSIGIVVLLFVLSEDIIHHRNNFIRRFPPAMASPIFEKKLDFNSYYLAGFGNGKIYLGNITAPLTVTILDTLLHKQERYMISLSDTKLNFKSIKVAVRPPYFYVFDGSVPCLFSGKISNWKAQLWPNKKVFFTNFEPIDSVTVAFRGIDTKSKENVLGIVSAHPGSDLQFSDKLLEKQIDGIFDTDGMLLYNVQMQKLLYTYYYRNQYIVADKDLNLEYRGKTIDTNTIAKIKVAFHSKEKQSQLSGPPLIVNKDAVTDNNYLYINAALMGKFERSSMWKNASIIDIYDIDTGTYISSFYIYNKGNKKVRQFKINSGRLVAFFGQDIVVYKLRY